MANLKFIVNFHATVPDGFNDGMEKGHEGSFEAVEEEIRKALEASDSFSNIKEVLIVDVEPQ